MKFFLDKDAEYDHVAYSTEALELHTDIASASSHPVVRRLLMYYYYVFIYRNNYFSDFVIH